MRMVRSIGSSIAVLALLWLAPVVSCGQGAAAKEKQAWEVVKGEGFGIVAPAGWRNFEAGGRYVLFRQGDGIGVPMVDENGAPVQVGLTVEKYSGQRGTVEEGIKSLAANARRNPRLVVVGEDVVEKVKLDDGTDAMLLITRFVKDGTRGSLQMKMLAKDQAGNGWVVSAFVVAGKESKLPVAESGVGQWLRAHVASFCLDAAKVDAGKLKGAYEKRERK